MVTVTGVEPASPRYKLGVLPLDDTVVSVQVGRARRKRLTPHLHCKTIQFGLTSAIVGIVCSVFTRVLGFFGALSGIGICSSFGAFQM